MIAISVIIPSFKPGQYVLECLDSLMSQTLDTSLFEIIIVLNGPKEPYYSMLFSYSLQYKNVKLLYEETSGVSNARNVGLEVAIGEYIAFVDDDDIVSSSYLELLWRCASKDTISMSNIYSFVKSIDEKKDDFFVCKQLRKMGRNKQVDRSFFFYRSFLAFPVAKLIHRDIIGTHRFDKRFANGEDALFITSITDNLSHIVFTPDNAIYYVRERVGSATRRKLDGRKFAKETFNLILAYMKIYLTHPFSYNLSLFLSRIPAVIKGNLKIYFATRR